MAGMVSSPSDATRWAYSTRDELKSFKAAFLGCQRCQRPVASCSCDTYQGKNGIPCSKTCLANMKTRFLPCSSAHWSDGSNRSLPPPPPTPPPKKKKWVESLAAMLIQANGEPSKRRGPGGTKMLISSP